MEIDYILRPSNKTMKIFNMAAEYSVKSDMTNKHGSVITRGGRVVSYGHNHYKNNISSFGNMKSDMTICAMHAEVHALKKLYDRSFNKRKLSKYCLYVVRLSKNGEYMNSKPCSNCIHILKINNISKVYYSMGNNRFRVAKINDIEPTHSSQGSKHLKKLKEDLEYANNSVMKLK